MPAFRPALSALMLAASLLAACGGGDGDDIAGAPPPSGLPEVGASVTVKGRLTAPDGATAIANALVYVKDSEAGAAGDRLSAALPCGAPPTASWASACTGADGRFSIVARMPAAATLVAVKGAFTQETPIAASADGAVDAGTVAFAAATGQRLAVVTGVFDRIQDVLAKLGYGRVQNGKLEPGSESFALFDGDLSLPDATYPGVDALFQDRDGDGRANLFDYDVVFFNCGLDERVLAVPANVAALRAYVEAGGRLYASDWAYDFVERVFPAAVDFEGSAGTPAATPEAQDFAQVGEPDITVKAVLDPALEAWLQGVACEGGACLDAEGLAPIEGFLGGWAVVNSVQAGTRTWAAGPVTFSGQAVPVDRPLTVSFGVGRGRVTFTSYHTEPDVTRTGFLPQERILQFLVFEL